MKKINLVLQSIIVVIILLMFSTILYSQSKSGTGFISVGHDSLTIDGANGNTNYFNNLYEDCLLKVIKVKGKVPATIVTYTIVKDCIEYDTIPKLTSGLVKVGDIVIPENVFRTEDFGELEVETPKGTKVWLGPATEFKMGRDYCKGNGLADLYSGRIFIEGANGEGNRYIAMKHGMTQITNTKFSLEIVKEGEVTTEILRVYEGSVSFGLNMQNKDNVKNTEDKAAEMKKLTDDFQSGKISIEEFTKKMADLQKEMTANQPQNAVIVNAGYESKIVGPGINPTEPVSFDTNENHWWENK